MSSEPFVPTQQTPPLIYSVYSKGLGSQPTLRLNRLDSSKYSSPVKTIAEPLKTLASEWPLSLRTHTHTHSLSLSLSLSPAASNLHTQDSGKQEESLRDLKPHKKSVSSGHRHSVGEERVKKKQSSQTAASDDGSMVISIDMARLQNRATASSGPAGKKRGRRKKKEGLVVSLDRRMMEGPVEVRSEPFTMMAEPPPSQLG